MNEDDFNSRYLTASINGILDDTGAPFILKCSVFTRGRGLDQNILNWLRGLEKEGVLVFLLDPYEAGDDERLIEMKSYIGRTSPYVGFLNYCPPDSPKEGNPGGG